MERQTVPSWAGQHCSGSEGHCRQPYSAARGAGAGGSRVEADAPDAIWVGAGLALVRILLPCKHTRRIHRPCMERPAFASSIVHRPYICMHAWHEGSQRELPVMNALALYSTHVWPHAVRMRCRFLWRAWGRPGHFGFHACNHTLTFDELLHVMLAELRLWGHLGGLGL